jgi:hypothetical protein
MVVADSRDKADQLMVITTGVVEVKSCASLVGWMHIPPLCLYVPSILNFWGAFDDH